MLNLLGTKYMIEEVMNLKLLFLTNLMFYVFLIFLVFHQKKIIKHKDKDIEMLRIIVENERKGKFIDGDH